MEAYCHHLTLFNTLKSNFLNTAFYPNQTICTNTSEAIKEATLLHNFTENNTPFLNQVIQGCHLGDPNTACKIGTSNASEIYNKFNASYYNYLNDPSYLCTAFSEYANDLENIFITSGCYLKYNATKIPYQICKFDKDSSLKGYKCHRNQLSNNDMVIKYSYKKIN